MNACESCGVCVRVNCLSELFSSILTLGLMINTLTDISCDSKWQELGSLNEELDAVLFFSLWKECLSCFFCSEDQISLCGPVHFHGHIFQLSVSQGFNTEVLKGQWLPPSQFWCHWKQATKTFVWEECNKCLKIYIFFKTKKTQDNERAHTCCPFSEDGLSEEQVELSPSAFLSAFIPAQHWGVSYLYSIADFALTYASLSWGCTEKLNLTVH